MRVAAMMPNGRGGLFRGQISIETGRIVEIEPMSAVSDDTDVDLDFTPHVALPGFVDLQINGAFGHDITTDPSTMWPIGERLPGHGVTAFLPTVITSPPAQRQAAYLAFKAPPAGYCGAAVLGLHIEGPELSPDYAGTHPQADLACGTEGLADELLSEVDVVSLVTIAPEIEGSLDSIARLAQAGIVISIGHTAATAVQTNMALSAGATAFTHLFNGMGPLHHREVGAVGAGLLCRGAYISLIADEHHLSEEAIQIAWRMAGPERICLVTDAMAGMSSPAGTYRIGSQLVECGDAARNGGGSLAGSLLTMPEAVRRMREITGATWDELAQITSANQADLLGEADRGRLSPGQRADVAILDSQLQPVATLIEGRVAYRQADRVSVRLPSPETGPAASEEAQFVTQAGIGVDIGGSSFRVGLFDGGVLREVQRGKTSRNQPPAAVLAKVQEAIKSLTLNAVDLNICGVGIACAGIVDSRSGTVIEAANLDWHNVAVADAIRTDLGLPVSVDHDVYLAAKAEWETGTGVGVESMLYLSLGTGVAARMFEPSDSYRGHSWLAGELGFIPVGSGGRTLESVASGRAICDTYRAESGRNASAVEIINSSSNDPVAAQVWSVAADALAQGLATAVCLNDPEIVVLGGGLSNAGHRLIDTLSPRLAALLEPLRSPPPVHLAAHGDLSGLVGAALLALRTP